MPLQEEFEKQGIWLFRYRGVLPIFIFLIGAGLVIYSKYNPQVFALEESPYEVPYFYFCLLVSLIGLAIRIYTVGHTPPNTSGRNTKEQIADTLNTTGIYSTVRHPLYVGNFFMWLGPALLTGNIWFVISFILFYWLYYERIMFAEEQFLRRKFGNVYLDWASNIPAFIPSFRNFKKPALPFNWKKVLKKEKTGIFLTFLIFAALHVAGQVIQDKGTYDYVIIGLLGASIVYYIIVKLLGKQLDA